MKTIDVRSPFDQHLITSIDMQSDEQAQQAMEKAYALFCERDKWIPKAQRITILKNAHRIAADQADALAKTIAEEGGKPLIDAQVEVKRAISGFALAAEYLASMGGKEIPMQITAESMHRWAFTFHEPRGVVLAISAFNHPLNLIIHQVIPAIAVGCPVIVKPSLRTPLSCSKVIQILQAAGLPPEWCQQLNVDNETTLKLVSDQRVSFLSFIGSSPVGWMLRSKLAPGAICTLEHGGAAPVIVEPDADLGEAVACLVKGGFYHAGQVCVSVQRIYAHASILDRLCDGLIEKVGKLIVGDPLDPKTEVGPLIAHSEVDRIDAWVKEAIEGGAQLLCGGRKISDSCYQPTILLNPPGHVRLSKEEIFGPVVSVYAYDTLHEAIDRANKPFFCFQAAVFTKNIDSAMLLASRLTATGIMINDHSAFRTDWMPFGGCKDSGLGVGGIPYAMEEMTFKKTVVFKSNAL